MLTIQHQTLAIVVALGLLPSCATRSSDLSRTQQNPPTREWHFSLEYRPGGTATTGTAKWTAVVDSSGMCEVRIQRWDTSERAWAHTSQSSALTADAVESILVAVQGASFNALRTSYSANYERSGKLVGISDQDTLVLEFSQGASSHRVEVYGVLAMAGALELGIQHHPDEQAARRIAHIMAAVLVHVPSPNDWQTASLYSQHS